MTIGALLTFLIYIAVVAIVLGLVFWVVSEIGFPPPVAKVIRIAVVVIATLIIVVLLLHLVGVPFERVSMLS